MVRPRRHESPTLFQRVAAPLQPTKLGRDWKLIRELMLRMDRVLRPGATTVLSGDHNEMVIEGYTAEQINHHLSLLKQMGFIDPAGSQPAIGVALKCITPAGYDFLGKTETDWKKLHINRLHARHSS